MSAPPTADLPALPRGVTRPIPGELLRLALPVLASQALRIAYQWVDALWVRGLGVEATAADLDRGARNRPWPESLA